MQFSSTYLQLVLVALSVTVGGSPIAQHGVGMKRELSMARAEGGTTDVLTSQDIKHWLATTDAKLTYIGTPINVLSADSALAVTVVYCSGVSGNVCGGACTVYSGSQSGCLSAPDTQCLSATVDVQFCNGSDCDGDCNSLDECGVRLEDNFCYTPGTNSIFVPSH
ncbi:hypothetical protein NM688_g2664 [Phlebia brevispora]|uniref:Uncharacterized protein n=1 Tax=Phlebia brevispora TaxID=194682 RepID=A0ACC1T878_9APHY|nr:hypothetical protein NM688_g2664 [Phlebia brevispora]